MELVRGRTLRQALAERRAGGEAGRLRPFDAWRVACEVAEGLAELHARGIVHRDLKPENVMLGEADGRVKLLDFGLAHQDGGDPSEAAPVGFSGTPGYVAPERFEGHSLDPRTDVFSLGVLLYEIVTGKRPFPIHAGHEAFLSAVARGPDFADAGFGPRLGDVTACMLAPDPSERFADGTEAHLALLYVHREPLARTLRSPQALGGDILWVDADLASARPSIEALEGRGHRVQTVPTVTMAVRRLLAESTGDRGRKRPPRTQVIVFAIRGAVLDARDASHVETLAKSGRTIPVLVLSPHVPPEDLRALVDRGARACVGDPGELALRIPPLEG
jgi:serine/threonine-protein kinase